ncbi:hypothetical protein DFP93_101154 [Aneurinibacillus soli]|uniref:Uncharacterized protein n=1 Tax=Aneurinibacillus soli TaxID=1500254 RepID=A0A0U5BIS1_9BACL|nr:hypothetical protein [Aneurinibacillus soli]PYE64129.1 hypothetical protein DFP93_101154 [Aneurinibacillus soli]BAU28078.1 hypothetical protein CB4_02252 [Aneurinibacillus soli]
MKKLNLLPHIEKKHPLKRKLIIAGSILLTCCAFVYGYAWIELHDLTKTEQEWAARTHSLNGVDKKLVQAEHDYQEKINNQASITLADNQTFFLLRDIALYKPETISLSGIETIPGPEEKAKDSTKKNQSAPNIPSALVPAPAAPVSSETLVQIKGQTESLQSLSEFTHSVEQLSYVQKVWMQDSYEYKLYGQPKLFFTLHITLK